MVPILLAILVGGYFLYVAIERESIQGFIIALLSLVFALRTFFSRSSASSSSTGDDHPAVHEENLPADDVLNDKFYCENCGTRVAADAAECPKCGMKFG